MNKWLQWLNPRGAKPVWFILGLVFGAVWALLFLALVDYLMQMFGERMVGVDTTLMLGIFIGMVTIGFLLTIITRDKRGITYGLYAGLACMTVCGILLFKNSLTLVPLVGLMGPLGGFNGAGLGEMFNRSREARKKDQID